MENYKPKAMDKKIFLISGLVDVQKAGNQSFKNTVKYLSEFGNEIHVFSFLPEWYPNLENPKNVFYDKVVFHRMPRVLSIIFYFGREIKNSIGKAKLRKKAEISKSIEYFEDYNILGRISYIVFLFVFYLPFELLRCIYHYIKLKPKLFYGYEVQGAVVAGILGKLFNIPVITRFQGTPLSVSDIAVPKRRLLNIDFICAMKIPCDAIIMANDGTMGDKILESLGINKRKIYFWMNGLDIEDLMLPDDFDPMKFKKELGLADKKIILMISKLKSWKRVDRGIYLMHKLVKECKIENAILLIIGDGPEKKRLEGTVENLNIRNFVKFIGALPHKETGKYYSIADVFLSFYDISNLGNPVLEALYYGVPIVTIKDGTTSYILEHEYNAILIDKEKIESEAHIAVKRLLDDPDLRKQLSENGKITFTRKIYSWRERIKLENELIEKIIGVK